MKITKQEIDFFNPYISKDLFRNALRCVYLDLSEIRTEIKPEGDKRYGRLVATNAFCLGSLEVELSPEDTESYLIPYEHLAVAKEYLVKLEKLEVIKDDRNTFFKTNKAIITIDNITGENFPEWKRVVTKEIAEYSVKIGVGELQNVLMSFKKLGIKNLLIKMVGNNKPIYFESLRSDITSILMPVRIDDDKELGVLQKKV